MSERELPLDEWLTLAENNQLLLESIPDVLKDHVVKRFHDIEKTFRAQIKVYISYSSLFLPETITEFANKLQENLDYKVLIDKNPHKETQLEEDFQKAVDDADVFVLFFNEAYKSSELCASEVLYAERRNKRMLAVSMDKTQWGRWLNFYLGEHLWLKFADDQPVEDLVKDVTDRVQQILTQPAPHNNRFEYLTAIDVPSLPQYFERKLVEDFILAEIRNTVQRPQDGVMVVSGEGGIGKTAMIAHMLLDKSNTDFFVFDCGVHTAIWVNCIQWSDAGAFTETQQRAFIDRLLVLGKQAASSDPSFSTMQFFEVDDIVQHYRKHKKSLIFVFDNVSHIKLIECFRRHSQTAACCVITRQLPPSKLLRKTIQLSPWSEDELVGMLEVICGLEGKLEQKQLRGLAKRCDGLPMIAGLMAARFGDIESHLYDQECEDLLKEQFSRRLPQKVLELFEFNITRAEIKEKKLRQLFFALLMFDRAEPMYVDDIAILWGYEGENYNKGVLRTRGLCRVLERKWLLIRLQDYGTKKEDCFAIHQLIHEAAFHSANIFFGVKSIEEMRRKIASGVCSVVDDEKDSSHSLIGIVGETILQKRRFLLEKIVDKCDPRGLAELCGQKSEKTGGMTFLHFLYNTEWPDNVMLKWNINLGINHSYRLIAKILQILYRRQLSFDKSITDTDTTFDCFLIDIYNQENSSLYSVDRQKVLKFLTRWKREYYDCKSEKEAVEKFGFHPAITYTVRGDFKEVKHHFSMPSLINPTSETEIDKGAIVKSAIEAAARHGHLNIFRYLFEEHFNPTETKTSELLRAFMLAAANGHIEIVQRLHGENKCDSFTADEYGMTACMHAARGGHLGVIEYLFVYAQNPDVLTVQDKSGFTALMYAARFGHERTVHALHRMNPAAGKIATNDNWTALSYAAANGYIGITTFLHGCYADAIKLSTTEGQMLPIMTAAKNGHVEVVRYLHTHFKDGVKFQDAKCWTALMYAASNGNFETVVYLYEQYKPAISIADAKGLTPLMAAAQNGYSEVVNFFIEKPGIDLNARSKEGMTAFQYGAFGGHLGVVKLLAEKDKSVLEITTANNRKCSGLTFAVMKGHLDIVQYLYNMEEKSGGKKSPAVVAETTKNTKPNSKETEQQIQTEEEDEEDESFMLLISSILTGHLEVVAFLAEQHPHTLRHKDSEGQTALMAAAGWGFLDIAEYLYSKFPNAVELQDNEGMLPLMRAAAKGSLPVVEYLYEKYPDAATLPAADGSVCMTSAVKSGNMKVIEFFYQNAPETLTASDNEGVTTLMVAVSLGFVPVAEFLVKKSHGTLVSSKDQNGMTAMSHAAKHGKLEACKFLHGENVFLLKTSDGANQWLPISHAVMNGHLAVVKFLFEEYPDCAYTRDKNSKVPLMIAAELGQIEIAQFLCQQSEEAAAMKDANEDNAFMIAMKNDHPKVLQVLVDICRGTVVRTVDSEECTLLTHACRLGKLDMVEILYNAYPEALRLESNEGMMPMSYAAARGFLDIVTFLYSKNRDSIAWLDRNGNLPFTYAVRSRQQAVVEYLCENMLNETTAELLTSKTNTETIVGLCRFAERLQTSEDWASLFQPLLDACEYEQTVVAEADDFVTKRRYNNIESPFVIRSLEIIRGITERDETFTGALVEKDGLKVFAKLLLTLREFRVHALLKPGNSSPYSYVDRVDNLSLSIIRNVAENSQLRHGIATNADLVTELLERFVGDISNGTDQRPWHAAFILALMLQSEQDVIVPINKEMISKELWARVELWNDVIKIELGNVEFGSFSQMTGMLMNDDNKPPGVRRFALWLLTVLIEWNEERYRPLIVKDGITETVRRIQGSLLPVDEIGSNLAERFVDAMNDNAPIERKSAQLRRKLAFPV